MASFMNVQYDSDSDSAEDLDFLPASDASGSDSGSDSDSDRDSAMADEDEAMGEDGSGQAMEQDSISEVEAVIPDTLSTAKSSKKATTTTTKKKKPTAKKTAAAVDTSASKDDKPKAKKGPKKGAKAAAAAAAAAASGATGPVSGLAKGTKGKGIKASKAAMAAAAAEAAAPQVSAPQGSSMFKFLNHTQIDEDHPMETFRFPYSPFTPEFRQQHQARDRMTKDLSKAVAEMKRTNHEANGSLLALDHELQRSRQELRTSLDEIQFRKSQLRDMSLMAVDIVRKLASPGSASSGFSKGSRIAALVHADGQHPAVSEAGTESRAISGHAGMTVDSRTGMALDARYSMDRSSSSVSSHDHLSKHQPPPPPQQPPHLHSTWMSHADQGPMDIVPDMEEEGVESDDSLSQSLKGLNEGNVRSFLERIRELEQKSRPHHRHHHHHGEKQGVLV